MKFIRTHKILTDEEILRQKPDFDFLLKTNPVTITPKNVSNFKWWLMGGGGAAILVGIVLFYTMSSLLSNEKLSSFLKINPPANQTSAQNKILDKTSFRDHTKKNDAEEYWINPSKKNVIFTDNGSMIEIPASVFVDKEGRKVERNVRLNFKDYYQSYDIYRSGISMQYDSAGKSFSFESAGMFDIQAFSDDESVFIAKGKAISVSLLTSSSEPRFNTYYKDPKINNWVYIEKAKLKPFPKYVDSRAKNELRELKNQENKSYAKINVAGVDSKSDIIREQDQANVFYGFNVEVDFNKFARLRERYNKSREKMGERPIKQRSARMNFFISTDDEHFSQQMFAKTWYQMNLISTVGRNQFNMRFKSPDTTIFAIVEPMLLSDDSVIYVNKTKGNGAVSVDKKRLEDLKKKWQKQTGEMISKFVKSVEIYPKGVCKIEIRNFGLHNVDFPWARLSGYALRFLNEKDHEISSGLIYVYNKVKKTVERYSKFQSMISFYGNDAYVFWIVDDKSIYITTLDVPYKELEKQGFDKKIHLNTYSIKEGMAELRQLMSYKL